MISHQAAEDIIGKYLKNIELDFSLWYNNFRFGGKYL